MIDTTGGDPLDPRRIALWEAVNRYARACGGDTGARISSTERQLAVVAVEEAVRASRSSSGSGEREALERVEALANELEWAAYGQACIDLKHPEGLKAHECRDLKTARADLLSALRRALSSGSPSPATGDET